MMKFLSLVLVAILSPILSFASVTSQVTKSGPFAITGSPQVIPVGFNFQQASDLLVLDYGTSAVTHDPALVLVRNSDYTVTGGGYNAANQMQSGSISVVSTGTNAVATGDYLVIMRASPINQTSSFTATGPLSIQLLEQMGDKLATLSQQVNEIGSRSLRFENFETADGTLSLAARKSKLIGFDANGALSFSTGGGGSGTTYTAGPGLLLSSNQFSVNPAQTLTSLVVTNPIGGSLAGNANSATQLVTGRTINGVNFDGTANIVVTADAGTLTGASLNSTITAAPGLLSAAVGTFGNMAIQNKTAVQITGGTITGMPTPSAASDVANKSYVDSLATGIVQRTGVQVASTGNIASLSGEQTIDGVLTSTSRILVKNQTLTQNNGIYVTAAGAWSRASDSNTAAQLKIGYYYFVSLGTTQGSTGWTIQTQPTVLGTDPVVFGQFSASTTYTAGTGLSLAGNVFSVNSNQTLGTVTTTGGALNGTIGATTPASAVFTSASSTSGALNATLGVATPNLGYFTNLYSTGPAAIGGSTNAGVASLGLKDAGYRKGLTFSRTGDAQRVLMYIGDGTNSTLSDDFYTDVLNSNWHLRAGASGTTPIADFTSTGINNAAIGATTPSTVVGTTFNTNSNANRITSKANFNLSEIDIRDYGATTGSSDNTTVINNAIAAASTGQSVIIPEGTWQFQGTLTVSNKTGVTIRGTGMGSVLQKTANFGSAGLDITGTSGSVTVSNLWLTTTASARSGGHLVQLNGDGNRLESCRFSNSAEFTIFAGTSASSISSNVTVINCEILGSKADGIHFGAVRQGIIANNLINDTSDDAIAVAGDVFSNASYYSDGVLITGNKILNSASRGILLEDCQNVSAIGNYISGTVSAGIWTSTYRSTTWFNTNIFIKDNVLYNVTNSSGAGRAGILCAYTNSLDVSGNRIYNTAGSTLSSIFLCDCSSVNVSGNNLWNTGVHGVVGYDSTTTGPSDFGPAGRTFSANWNYWDISNNYFNTTQNAGGTAIYVTAPSSGVTINSVSCTGNREANWQGGVFIGYNHVNLGKFLLNTSLDGKSVTAGAGNTSITATPNY